MTTSGTYLFSPPVDEVVDESFERVGVDPATLTGRHARSARMSLNLLFSDWATQGVAPVIVENKIIVQARITRQQKHEASESKL